MSRDKHENGTQDVYNFHPTKTGIFLIKGCLSKKRNFSIHPSFMKVYLPYYRFLLTSVTRV